MQAIFSKTNPGEKPRWNEAFPRGSPLAMQAIFSKTNPGEKPRSNDDEDLYLNNPAAYNTFPESGMQNPMQQGWAPAGPPGQAYGSAPMPQRVDSAHGGPPASGMGGPAPGMGGAAW